MLLVVLLGLAGVCLSQQQSRETGPSYTSQATCSTDCRGGRVQAEGQCRAYIPDQRTNVQKFYCQCQPHYFSEEKKCDEECENAHWSLFSYGECVKAAANEWDGSKCGHTCGYGIRVWTTVFIFVVFTAAVLIILFILPMFIASCTACITTGKERKSRKKAAATEGVYAASYDGRTDVAVKGQPATPYNPYMYWPQSYYQGR